MMFFAGILIYANLRKAEVVFLGLEQQLAMYNVYYSGWPLRNSTSVGINPTYYWPDNPTKVLDLSSEDQIEFVIGIAKPVSWYSKIFVVFANTILGLGILAGFAYIMETIYRRAHKKQRASPP